MSSMQIVMSAAVENGMRLASVNFAKGVIEELSKEGVLTCSVESAMRMFNFEEVTIASKRSVAMKKVRASQKSSEKSSKTTGRCKPEMTLPFCGEIEESWCKGVRFNKGLHTQCTNDPSKDCSYCKTCQKSAANSASGKPQYGDIKDRLTGPLLEYRDPKGKLTTCYANVAKKENWDLERAQVVASSFGWTIPLDQLEVKVKKTGRPASTKVKKTVGKKGRPVKVKSSEEMSMDDQIAKLVAEAADDVLSVSSDSSSKKVVRVKKVKKVKKKATKSNDGDKAEKDALKAAAKAEKDALKAAAKAEKDALKAAEKAEKDALKAAEKAEKDALKAAEKAEKDALKAAEKAEKDALKAKKESEKVARAEVAQKKIDDATTELASLSKELNHPESEAPKKLGELKKAIAVLKKEKRELSKASKKKEEVKTVDLGPELTVEAVEQLQSSIVEEEDGDEEDITLDESTPKIEIEGTEYYVTKAYGLPAVLFDADGECIGAYDELTKEIQELAFEE
jgi:hypothetical protein